MLHMFKMNRKEIMINIAEAALSTVIASFRAQTGDTTTALALEALKYMAAMQVARTFISGMNELAEYTASARPRHA